MIKKATLLKHLVKLKQLKVEEVSEDRVRIIYGNNKHDVIFEDKFLTIIPLMSFTGEGTRYNSTFSSIDDKASFARWFDLLSKLKKK